MLRGWIVFSLRPRGHTLRYEEQVDRLVAQGWRVHRQTGTYTVLHKGDEIGCTPQCMDMLLILVTGGLWLIVHLVRLSFFGLRERRVMKLPVAGKASEGAGMVAWCIPYLLAQG